MLKLDLHVHSHCSPDGFTSHLQIIDIAEEIGLDGLSITDHDLFDSDLHHQLQAQTDLLLIPGEEVSTKTGHILAYFISEPIDPWRPYTKIIQEIHEQGGLAVAAHPYRVQNVDQIPDDYFESFDGIEVFNARSGHPDREGTPNHRAYHLSEKLNSFRVGGSDSHLPWTVGNGFTRVKSKKNLDSVHHGLLKGRTEVEGTVSLQLNKSLSELIYITKSPSLRKILGWFPKTLRWAGKDLMYRRST